MRAGVGVAAANFGSYPTPISFACAQSIDPPHKGEGEEEGGVIFYIPPAARFGM